MANIAINGAGRYVFSLRLVGALLSFSSWRKSTFTLMDLWPGRVEQTAVAARELVSHDHFPARVETVR